MNKDELVFLITGLLVIFILTVVSEPMVKDIEVIQSEKGQSIILLSKIGTDSIHVLCDGKYISLRDYLEGISDRAERAKEEINIKKLAGKYD